MVTCFVVRESARGTGLLARLLAAAVEHARESGAAALEAFPLDVTEAPEIDPDTLFAGTVQEYVRQGFVVRARSRVTGCSSYGISERRVTLPSGSC